ncbi:MAG TPA: isochorismatase family protein [Patescibacteria group bacterium]
MTEQPIEIGKGWGVLHVDPQVDFMEGGALGVDGGHSVIKPINRLTRLARMRDLPVAMSADWHPKDTKHFQKWPVHCVAGTNGAKFGPGIDTYEVEIFHKGMSREDDGYSPWEATSAKNSKRTLDGYFRRKGVRNLIVDGLATDYCVKAGVLDALKKKTIFGRQRYNVFVVEDAIAAVNLNPEDGANAISEMKKAGAQFIPLRRIV